MIYYLIFVNILTFIFYGVDKRRAILKKSRISEFELLACSFFGGSIGAICGMFIFRHKTKKIKFWLLNFLFLIWSFVFFKYFKLF